MSLQEVTDYHVTFLYFFLSQRPLSISEAVSVCLVCLSACLFVSASDSSVFVCLVFGESLLICRSIYLSVCMSFCVCLFARHGVWVIAGYLYLLHRPFFNGGCCFFCLPLSTSIHPMYVFYKALIFRYPSFFLSFLFFSFLLHTP